MQAVLGLVPHRRLRTVDHLRRHLIAAMGGEAMHEDRILVSFSNHLAIDLEGTERRIAPVSVIVAHRHPYIGRHAIGAPRGLKLVLAHLDLCALLLRPREQLGRRREILGRGDVEPEAEPRRSVHPGGSDIIGVPDPGNCAAFDRALQLLEGHDIGHDLAGMGAAGEPVDHGHARMRGQFGQSFLWPGAEHDRVDVARQHACGIGHGLSPPELHVLRI